MLIKVMVLITALVLNKKGKKDTHIFSFSNLCKIFYKEYLWKKTGDVFIPDEDVKTTYNL